jgi:hypothetical protein
VFLCVVLSCAGRGFGAGLIPPPKKSYQMSNGSKKLKQEPRIARHCRSPTLRAERKSNNRMVAVNDELRRIWKEETVACVKVILQQLPREAVQGYENPQSR